MIKEYNKEVKEAIRKLIIQKHKGSNLSCGCGNKGNFGAIQIFTDQNGHKYKICGWCESIHPRGKK